MTLATLDSDQLLVDAARGGDDRAFEELYARYRQQIRGFAYRLTHDHDRADDVTQEVFISALRRLRETDRPISFRPWIYEIARNACIDEHRRASRRREIPFEQDGDSGWFGAATAIGPAPEDAVASKQTLEDLCGAFRGLSDRHHKVIVLREFEGLSYSQIGDQLGMSKPVVESTLFRARRRLTEEYEDLSSGRRCEYVQRLLTDDGHSSPGTLGLRDRRALARHLEHCRSCRREARAAGWEDPRGSRLIGKVAALLPIPILRLPARLFAKATALQRGAHHAVLPSASAALQYGESAGPMAMGGRSAFAAATLLAAAVGGGLAGTVVNQSHDALAGARPARALAAGTPVAAGTRTAPPAARSGVISAVVLSYAGVTGTSARTASGGHGRVGTVRLGSTGTVLEPTHASRTAVPIAPGPATHSASGTPSAGAPPTGVTGAVGVTTAPDVPGPAGVAAGAAGDAGSGTGPASGITPGTDPFGDPGTPVTQPTLRSTVPVTVGGPTGTVSQLPTGLAGAGNATNGTSAPGTASAGLSTSSTIQSSVAATNQAGAGLKPASNATAGGLSAASTATSGLNGRSVVR